MLFFKMNRESLIKKLKRIGRPVDINVNPPKYIKSYLRGLKEWENQSLNKNSKVCGPINEE